LQVIGIDKIGFLGLFLEVILLKIISKEREKATREYIFNMYKDL